MREELLARLRTVIAAAAAKKAFQVLALDVGERTSIADVFVLCSVGSTRQAQAVADEVERQLAVKGEVTHLKATRTPEIVAARPQLIGPAH